MNINFGKHIITLLKEHECVVLPGIGALLLKQKPAHLSGGQIFPASKTIQFNKYINTNDNLIASSLLESEELSFLSAKLELDKFVSDIKFQLAQKGFFDIEELGRFKQNEGILSFVSNAQMNHLDKNNFGFDSLSVFEVQREIIADKKETLKIENKVVAQKTILQKPAINKTRKIRKRALVGLAAIFVLMFAISSLMFTNTSFDHLKVQNANVLNFLVPSNSQTANETTALKPTTVKTNIEAITMSRNEIQQENTSLKGEIKETNEASYELKTETKNISETKIIAEVKEEIVAEKKVENNTISEEKIEAITEAVDKANFPEVLRVQTENQKGYYVIIGAFSKLANANKAKSKYSSENTCSIFKTENGMYRVGIFASTNKDTAIDIVSGYKKTNSSFWLMENQ